MRNYIELFTRTVIKNPALKDSEIVEFLLSNYVPEDIVFNIIIFTPVSFCRMYFIETGVKFSDFYIVKENDLCQTFKFHDNLVFQQSNIFFEENIKYKISKEDLISVAGRSSDFDVIIQCLEKNIDLRSIVTDPMVILY